MIEFALTSVPMAARLEVCFLSDGPSQAPSVPEDVSVLVDMFVDGPVR